MDLRRARIDDWLMGGLGLVLAVSLFLPWYGCAGSRPGAPPAGAGCRSGAAVSAWGALVVADVVMLVAGLVGVTVLVLTLLQRTPAVPLALTSLGVLVALAAAVLAVVRLVAVPEPAGVVGHHLVRLLGAWLGTGAALGLLAAMLAAMRDERVPSAMRGTEGSDPEPRLLALSETDAASRAPRETGGMA